MSYQRSLSFAVSTFPQLGITSGALTVTASGHGCTASFSCRYKYCTATFWNKGYSWILSSSISERSPRVFLTTLYSLGVCKHSISHLSSLSLVRISLRWLYSNLIIIYYRRDISIREHTSFYFNLYKRAICTCRVCRISHISLLLSCAFTLTSLRTLFHHCTFIPAHAQVLQSEFGVFSFKISLCFAFSANGSIRKLFTSSLRSHMWTAFINWKVYYMHTHYESSKV